jgi:hypothetical protein
MKCILFCLAFLLAAGTLHAREISDAPEAAILGFSPDGRYFAYEQFAYDIVSDALIAAIFVVDRTTNRQADGFPFGVIPEEIDGVFPARVGGFNPDPALLDTNDFNPDLGALRKALHEAAKPKLEALGIGVQGRRVAGVPLTQRSPAESPAAPLVFVLFPTIPTTGMPDQQLSYTLDVRQQPEPADCYDSNPPARSRTVTFDIIATQSYPELKDVGRAATTGQVRMEEGTCATGLWVSDIILPPGNTGSVAVLYLAAAWAPHADAAEWHALFVTLPKEEQQ